MSIMIQQTAEGPVATANSEGRTVAFTTQRVGQRFQSSAASVIAALDHVANETAAAADDLKPDALLKRIRAGHERHTGPAALAMRNEIATAKRDHATRLQRLMSEPSDPMIAAEDRAAFRAVSIGERRRWIANAGKEALAAIITVGRQRWPELDDAAWQAAVDRLAKLTFLEQSGVLANFSIQPTPAAPAPVGVDMAAAEAFADERITAFRAEQAETVQAERRLSDLISLVAVSCEMTRPDDAMALLGLAAA